MDRRDRLNRAWSAGIGETNYPLPDEDPDEDEFQEEDELPQEDEPLAA